MTSMASMEFGNHAATRSPATTPRACNAEAIDATRLRNSSHDRLRLLPASSMATKASPPPEVANMFSTTLSDASGKNCAVDIGAPTCAAINDRAPLSPTTPQASHTNDQNCSGCAIDHACKSPESLTISAKRFIPDLAMLSPVGVHRALAKSDIGTNLMKPL